MNETVIDVSDFTVEASNNGKSWAKIRKTFKSAPLACLFEQELREMIYEQLTDSDAIFCIVRGAQQSTMGILPLMLFHCKPLYIYDEYGIISAKFLEDNGYNTDDYIKEELEDSLDLSLVYCAVQKIQLCGKTLELDLYLGCEKDRLKSSHRANKSIYVYDFDNIY